MTHETIREKLTEFFDQEVSGSERLEIETHLQTCEECRQTVEQWMIFRTALTKSCQVEPSAAFVNKVMSCLEVAEKPEPAPPVFALPQWLLPVLGYTAVIILMVVAIADRYPLISAEEVLRADLPQGAQWTVAAEPPDTSKLLGM